MRAPIAVVAADPITASRTAKTSSPAATPAYRAICHRRTTREPPRSPPTARRCCNASGDVSDSGEARQRPILLARRGGRCLPPRRRSRLQTQKSSPLTATLAPPTRRTQRPITGRVEPLSARCRQLTWRVVRVITSPRRSARSATARIATAISGGRDARRSPLPCLCGRGTSALP